MGEGISDLIAQYIPSTIHSVQRERGRERLKVPRTITQHRLSSVTFYTDFILCTNKRI